MPADLKLRVLSELPTESPRTYRHMAEWVVRAWGDRELREALRSDPHAFFAARGVDLAPCDIHVVAGGEAPAPRGSDVWVPLPSEESAPVPEQAAMEVLRETGFGWLLGAGDIRALDVVPTPEPSASPVSAARARLSTWWESLRLGDTGRLRPVLAGAVVVLAAAVVVRVAGGTVEGGSAVGNLPFQATTLIAILAVGAIIVLALRNR